MTEQHDDPAGQAHLDQINAELDGTREELAAEYLAKAEARLNAMLARARTDPEYAAGLSRALDDLENPHA